MKWSIVFSILALFIASCSKEGSNPVEPINAQEKVTDYYPMGVGNYWIYEYYTSDSTLNFIDQNIIDSVYVEKDSICNGNVYAVVCSSYWSGQTLIRDSSDYLVTNTGKKIFTIAKDTSNFIDRYYPYPDNVYHETWKMKESDSTCSVPSGQYVAKYLLGTVTSSIPISPLRSRRSYYYAYVKSVGKVYERLGYVNYPEYIEERLIRYHINGKTM